MSDNGKVKPRHDAMWRLVLDGEIEVLDGTKIAVQAVTVGDADKRAIDDYARAAARATYEAALDPSSELYNARVIQVADMSRDELVSAVLDDDRFRLKRRVVSEIYPGEVKAVVDTIGDSIEREIEVERTEEETERLRAEWVSDQLLDRKTEYESVDEDDLRERVRKLLANNLATIAFSYAFQDYVLYCGIMKEDGKRFFGEVPKNTPERIKEQALALYTQVDPYLFRPT